MVAKEVFHVGGFFEDPYDVSIEVKDEAHVIHLMKLLKKLKFEDGMVNFPWGISFTLTAIDDAKSAAGIEYPEV